MPEWDLGRCNASEAREWMADKSTEFFSSIFSQTDLFSYHRQELTDEINKHRTS